MNMVIGGAYQGKLNYAKETFQIPDGWVDGASCTLEELAQCRGVYDFHLLIRRLLEEGQEADRLVLEAEEKNPEICIVTNELGYGVVPVDAFDRLWREKTGRICTELAGKAEEVHRVVCGIGMVIKK